MIDVDVRIDASDIEGLKKKLKKLGTKAPTAMYRAINAAASGAKKDMGKETSARYHIGSRTVTDTVHVTKANKESLKAVVRSRGNARKLSDYKMTTGRGIKAAVKKGPTKSLDGDPKAFMATMKNGHKDAFQRYMFGHKKAKIRSTRKPGRKQALNKHNIAIHTFPGPAIPSIIKNDETMEIIKKNASETLQRRLEHEIQNILQGGR